MLGRIGDYELLREIARGGQGVVYRARHLTLRREVALKMIARSAWATESQISRFRQEARITAELDHPAIVPIYEVGEVNGQHYLAMKLIDGVSLNQLPRDQEATARRAAEIIAETARAIHHAHEHGVLHRDVKPGNILLDTAGRPHITDFGLAKFLDGTDGALTQTMEVFGTPSYLAPEMAAVGAACTGPATDIYGLGAVLYFLLTRQPPFSGGSTFEITRHVIENEPPRPRALNPKTDRDLELICLKCLEKEPARRYASAAALADDLERFLRHEPVRARRSGFGYRACKWIRRHVAATAVVGAAAFAAVVLALALRDRSVQPALDRARQLLHSLEAVREDYALAEDLMKPVLARHPTDVRAVTLMAHIQNIFLTRGFDRSDERFAAARQYADRAVQLAPDDPDALGALGVYLLERRNDFPRAVQTLDRALALKPGDAFLHRVRVGTLFHDQNVPMAEAVAAAERAAALFPQDALTQYLLARVYRDDGRLADMEKYLDRAISVAPLTNAIIWKAQAALWVRGDTTEMKALLERVPPRTRWTERVVFSRWVHAMTTGRADEGIDALQRLPQNWLAEWFFTGPKHLLVAQLFELQGNATLARLQYEMALEEVRARKTHNPADPSLRVWDAWILHGLGRDEEALALYRDYFLPTVQRPYRVGVLNTWWFRPIACSLLLGDRATALELIREATSPEIDALAPAARRVPETEHEIGFAADRAQARAALRLRLRLDPRMAPWRDDPEILALIGETTAKP
jgi:tetratricopeptide (TPR) repeat protein/tRNA A-37 threonylcarbamoyl transferase component Bud32